MDGLAQEMMLPAITHMKTPDKPVNKLLKECKKTAAKKTATI